MLTGSKAPPQKVQFVDDLTRILTDHLPDFWRLGQTYLSGKLVKEVRLCFTMVMAYYCFTITRPGWWNIIYHMKWALSPVIQLRIKEEETVWQFISAGHSYGSSFHCCRSASIIWTNKCYINSGMWEGKAHCSSWIFYLQSGWLSDSCFVYL